MSHPLWWSGPEFLLYEDESRWPGSDVIKKFDVEKSLGKEQFEDVEKIELTGPVVAPAKLIAPFLTQMEWAQNIRARCSTWRRLIRMTAYVIKFLRRAMRKSDKAEVFFQQLGDAIYYETKDRRVLSHDPGMTSLEVSDYSAAQYFWLKIAQKEAFPRVFVRADEALVKRDLKQHGAFLDHDGAIRAQTRFQVSKTTPRSAIYPILLPRYNELIELFILDLHTFAGHITRRSTLARLSHWYRIIGGLKEVSRILSKCPNRVCNEPKPLDQQIGQLPPERIDASVPFNTVGIDLFGPLRVKEKFCLKGECGNNSNCKHRESKAWGCLINCFTTRAVALEIMYDMSTESFLAAFMRASNRYGLCSTAYSDNAKTFKAADRELKRLYKNVCWPEVAAATAQRGVQWRWSTELAPKTNGVSESLIKGAKMALKRTVGQMAISRDSLQLAFTCAEQMMNDRPLQQLEGSKDEWAITPSMLLLGRQIGSLPHPGRNPALKDEQLPSVTRLMMLRKRMMSALWKQWQRDYLWQSQYSRLAHFPNPPTLKIGQVVLLREKGLKTGSWRLARVTDLIEGNDGLVRKVALRLPSGAVILRHISHIALLEADIPECARPGLSKRQREEGLKGKSRDELEGGEQRRASERIRRRNRDLADAAGRD